MAKFRVAKTNLQGTGYANGTGIEGGLTSLDGSQIQPRVKIGTAIETEGSILRQKSANTFLVTDGIELDATSMIVGEMYQIVSTGTTDWTVHRVEGGAEIGAIFSAKSVGVGTGTVTKVKECTLVDLDDGDLTSNTMTITCSRYNATAFRAKRITNKFVWDFDNRKYRLGSIAVASTFDSIEIVAVDSDQALGTSFNSPTNSQYISLNSIGVF